MNLSTSNLYIDRGLRVRSIARLRSLEPVFDKIDISCRQTFPSRKRWFASYYESVGVHRIREIPFISRFTSFYLPVTRINLRIYMETINVYLRRSLRVKKYALKGRSVRQIHDINIIARVGRVTSAFYFFGDSSYEGYCVAVARVYTLVLGVVLARWESNERQLGNLKLSFILAMSR